MELKLNLQIFISAKMRKIFLAFIVFFTPWVSLTDARQIRQADQILFDEHLPEDVNLNRIAELPVKYKPFTYNQKYFPVRKIIPFFSKCKFW